LPTTVSPTLVLDPTGIPKVDTALLNIVKALNSLLTAPTPTHTPSQLIGGFRFIPGPLKSAPALPPPVNGVQVYILDNGTTRSFVARYNNGTDLEYAVVEMN
jgi:hypothetical protein